MRQRLKFSVELSGKASQRRRHFSQDPKGLRELAIWGKNILGKEKS